MSLGFGNETPLTAVVGSFKSNRPTMHRRIHRLANGSRSNSTSFAARKLFWTFVCRKNLHNASLGRFAFFPFHHVRSTIPTLYLTLRKEFLTCQKSNSICSILILYSSAKFMDQ